MSHRSEPAGRPAARAATLTERRRLATELEIAEAAARLFTERGTATVTAADIADAAGVGLRTFYRYFSGKEDAVAPLLTAGADEWRAALAAVDATVPMDEAIRRAMASTLSQPEDEQVRRRAGWMRGLLRAAEQDAALADLWYRVNRASERLLRPILAERAGCTDGALTIRLQAAAATDALRVALETWAQSDSPWGGPDGPSAIAAAAYGFLCGGPAAPPGPPS